MQKLRAQLRLISTERGDYGTPEDRGLFIDNFVDALEELLTPRAIATFTADEIRHVLLAYAQENLNSPTPITIEQSIMSRFAVLFFNSPRREVVLPLPPSNVVSLH